MQEELVAAQEETSSATGNGMLIVDLEATNGGRGYVELSKTTKGGNTFVTKASVHFYRQGDVWVPMNSCSLPLKAGETYTIKMYTTNPSISYSKQFIEF
jgi:hypothetical protein